MIYLYVLIYVIYRIIFYFYLSYDYMAIEVHVNCDNTNYYIKYKLTFLKCERY